MAVAVSAAVAIASLTALRPAGAGPLSITEAQPFACGALPSKPVGQAEQASAELGLVKATLTGTAAKAKYDGSPVLAHPALKIWAGGKVVYRGRLAVPTVAAIPPSGGVETEPILVNRTMYAPLCVARFGGPKPEDAVMVGMYSGGAHCCTWAAIYALPAGKLSLPALGHDFGDPGVSVHQEGTYSVLVSADDSFAYEFDAFAFTGLPILVLDLRGTHLVNTTKHYPGLVAADAKMYWTSYQEAQSPTNGEGKGGGLGVLAAWVADECTLGQGASALATVGTLESEGKLTGPPNQKDGPWPTGAKYVKTLKSFLAKDSYSC